MKKVLCAVSMLGLLGTSCVQQVARDGLGPNGGGSVLASIEGIDDVDRDKEETEYWLKCDNGVQILHSKIIEDADGNEFLQFDGKQIRDAAKCGMEVWNKSLVNHPDYEWLSRISEDSDEPVKGLLYASNYGKVESRKLSIELYKVYNKTDGKNFTATFAVSFDGEQELVKDRLVGTLSCGEGDDAYTHSSREFAFDGDTRNATITMQYLKVDAMTDRTCEALKVVETDDDNGAAKTFEATLAGVTFSGEFAPELDKTFAFPKEGSDPYVLKWVDDSPINTTITAGECFNVVVGNDECADKRVFDQPFKTNYLVAYVKGRTDNGRGQPRQYIVGMGEKGFGGLTADTFNVDMINQAIQSDDAAVRKTINFWAGNTAIIDDVKAGKLLTTDMITGDAYAGEEIDMASLAGIKFLHVSELYVHGFHAVDLADQEPALSWMAELKATKEDTTLTYIVGGADRGFVSTEYPIASDDGSALITLAALAADVADSGATSRWQTFQLKGDLGDDTTCALESTASVISEASSAVLSSDDGVGEALSACKADLSPLADLDASEYEVTLQGYRLGWQALSGRLQ